ncbi:hypothetical protein [Streptomyces roseirectus]|uniref:hypothetical protein n=1 Tax=Streptomyces roseirectus TaxID=2768066 RepID=UPI0024838251|nr:hypothetical protein [Streptomyces roseirectus]
MRVRRIGFVGLVAGVLLVPSGVGGPAWGDVPGTAGGTSVAAEAAPGAAVAPGAEGPAAPATLCAPAGTLRGPGGQVARVSLCAGSGTPVTAVSAPATCRRPGVRPACLTSGTWSATRDGVPVASGALPGSTPYPGPGTYEVTASVRVRSVPAGVELAGTVRATLTLTAPAARPTHRIEVDRRELSPGAVTTLTYTVARDSELGDGSGRFGLIGVEGMELTTADARCVNPLVGRYPATARTPYALDCALTDLQPGNPSTVVVRVAVGERCGTVVSKLGYWMPRGQALYTGGMLEGPTVGCGSSRR